MPTYEYYCTACGKTFDKSLPVDKRDSPCGEVCPCNDEKSGVIKRGYFTINVCDPTHVGVHRPPEGFKDVLREINKRTSKRMSTLDPDRNSAS